MRVVVKFHERAELSVLRWYTALGSNDRERRLRLAVYVAAMADRLRAFDGVPPEAAPDPRYRSIWAWHFTAGVDIRFTVRDNPPPPRGWWDATRWLARLIHRPTRTVLVLRVTDHPRT